MLDRDEYIEQAHFFEVLRQRLQERFSIQETLEALREETLATTNLPLAIDYLLSELKHQGVMAPALARLDHYFAPFQTYMIAAAEDDCGRFDFRMALDILHREALYRAGEPTRQGVFLYQFETLCRHRLNYDRGLAAIAADPLLDESWAIWIKTVRRQIGLIDFADMIYVRSDYYVEELERRGKEFPGTGRASLFGSREGKIAWANRRKDPLLLFAALQRQLGYPEVPRLKRVDKTLQLVPSLLRRVEHLEKRLKLMEDEQQQGIDLTKFYPPPK